MLELNKFPLFFLLFSYIFFVGCEKDIYQYPEEENILDSNCRVLILGNSYSRDAFSYMPPLLAEVGINAEVCILCLNGKTLHDHYDAISNNSPLYAIDVYDFDAHRWYTYTDTTALRTITSNNWQLVIMQEQSNTAKIPEKVSSNINNLTSYLRKILPDTHFAYMLNPPHPLGHSALGGSHNNEEYNIIADVAKHLVSEGLIFDIVPCGTAIQNARQTSLQQLGDYGDLSYEGNHLQEGLPCLIEAYVGAAFIANFFEIPYKIQNSLMKVEQTWVDQRNIPGRHGKVVSGNENQYEICKLSAYDAIYHPLVITVH